MYVPNAQRPVPTRNMLIGCIKRGLIVYVVDKRCNHSNLGFICTRPMGHVGFHVGAYEAPDGFSDKSVWYDTDGTEEE